MSGTPKPIYLNCADLAFETLEYFDPGSVGWLPWTGPATVTFCTKAVDAAGLATYTPIAGLGPFAMVALGGANVGEFYYVTPTSAINAALANDTFVNQTVYQVVLGGSASPPQCQAVQPRAVLTEYNPQ